MFSLLESSYDNGRLFDAFSRVQKDGRKYLDLENARKRMCDLMESSCDNGKLEDAFSRVQGRPKDTIMRADGTALDLEDARMRMCDLLESSCDNGKLFDAFSLVQKDGGETGGAKDTIMCADGTALDLEDARVRMCD